MTDPNMQAMLQGFLSQANAAQAAAQAVGDAMCASVVMEAPGLRVKFELNAYSLNGHMQPGFTAIGRVNDRFMRHVYSVAGERVTLT